jgi:Raf kinase inhibitor-like YbhB/YbcL family protein
MSHLTAEERFRLAPAALIVAVALPLLGAGCGAASKRRTPPSGGGAIGVTSDFGQGAEIPRAHTCDGRDLSPPVRAVRLPAATKEVVIVMRDPDAPGGDFIHWAIAGIAPEHDAAQRTESIALPVAARPSGAVLGLNSFGSLGYRGPCPPRGAAAHHYHITVYALDRPSMLKTGFSADAVRTLPVGGSGSLTGLYARR